ncbi:MAG: aminopeptidase P family protein [Candidatus Neomarinimicrobiota bacterium]
MFKKEIYQRRRSNLAKKFRDGVLLFMGNQDSPMNYDANIYRFRQDSTFLYYWGLDIPGLAALIDIDEGKEILIGHDLTIDEIVWMGPNPTISNWAARTGVKNSKPVEDLQPILEKALNSKRKIHFLPQYRVDNQILLTDILKIKRGEINQHQSPDFIRAVVDQRSVKGSEEIIEIESALETTYQMHTQAMRLCTPGRFEREIAGIMEGIALARGVPVSYPIIFTINGQTLHNTYQGNKMETGDIVINDSGAESDLHYASDITRTLPVSGKFTPKQRDIYTVVLNANMNVIGGIKAGVPYLDLHMLAAKTITEGLSGLGIMNGNIDEAVSAGAHALFFPHGLGHMMGLDVHDMEGLGEDSVGYDKTVKRSDQFGLQYLRLARKLETGFVLTVEPGIYFIPELIDRWQSEKRHNVFINYDKVNEYRDFGGIRIEDDVLVEKAGCKVLGKPIPKTIVEVETMCEQ